MSEEVKHTPYNTSPMSLEEREKELAKSGSGTALKKSQQQNPDKKKKKKTKMGGGDEPT